MARQARRRRQHEEVVDSSGCKYVDGHATSFPGWVSSVEGCRQRDYSKVKHRMAQKGSIKKRQGVVRASGKRWYCY
jgi:hypothetical protein